MATKKAKNRGTHGGFSFRKLNDVPVTKESVRAHIWEQAEALDGDKSVEITHPEGKESYIRACISGLNKEHGVSLSFKRVSETCGILFHNPNKIVRNARKTSGQRRGKKVSK